MTHYYPLLSLQMDRKFLESLRSDEQPANTRVTVLCKQGAVSLLNVLFSTYVNLFCYLLVYIVMIQKTNMFVLFVALPGFAMISLWHFILTRLTKYRFSCTAISLLHLSSFLQKEL